MPQTLAHRVDRLERKAQSLNSFPIASPPWNRRLCNSRRGARWIFFHTGGQQGGGRGDAPRNARDECDDSREDGRRSKETNTHMRVLHEDVISRIALLGESNSRRKLVALRRPRDLTAVRSVQAFDSRSLHSNTTRRMRLVVLISERPW